MNCGDTTIKCQYQKGVKCGMTKADEKKQGWECSLKVNPCSRNYIGFLHCPYEYNSCEKCPYLRKEKKQ